MFPHLQKGGTTSALYAVSCLCTFYALLCVLTTCEAQDRPSCPGGRKPIGTYNAERFCAVRFGSNWSRGQRPTFQPRGKGGVRSRWPRQAHGSLCGGSSPHTWSRRRGRNPLCRCWGLGKVVNYKMQLQHEPLGEAPREPWGWERTETLQGHLSGRARSCDK